LIQVRPVFGRRASSERSTNYGRRASSKRSTNYDPHLLRVGTGHKGVDDVDKGVQGDCVEQEGQLARLRPIEYVESRPGSDRLSSLGT
jgi:hypothetical protein